MQTKTRIAPSILAADFAALGDAIRKVEQGGADLIHVDVMDGHFVPNITIGPPVVKSLRKVTELPLDVHLMISDPDKYIPIFAEAMQSKGTTGLNILTVHAEASIHLDRTLNLIKSFGIQAGVAINPATPLSTVEHALPLADLLLIMSVNPGFGGQKFIGYSLDKIRKAREAIDSRSLRCVIEVDGGIDANTLPGVVKAGADILVAGAAVFSGGDPVARIGELLAIAASLGYHARCV